jgi:biotin carboxyl carrier protein
MEFEFVVEDREEKLSIEEKDGLWLVKFGDEAIEAEVVPIAPNTFWINASGKSFVAYAAENEGKSYVSVAGRQYCITKPASGAKRKSGIGGTLKAEEVVGAPMPGVIVKVSVSDGEVVKADQVLVVVESMKMENNIRARSEARVKRVHVKAGDSVNFGSALVELEPVAG